MAKEIIKTVQGGRSGCVVTVEKKIEPLPILRDIPKDRVSEFANGVIEHAQKPETLTLYSFFYNKGVLPGTIEQWREKFPEINEACNLARAVIGVRREEGALRGKLSPAVVLKTHPLYDKEYKELREWEAKLTAREEALSSGTQKIVIIEKFRETDVVPVKEKDE